MVRAYLRYALSWARLLVLASAVVLAACDSAEERVAKHQERGLELVAEGEYAKAGLEFRNALKLDDGFVPAHFEMAKLYEREQNFQGVVAHLNRIIEFEPGHVGARVKLAQIMMLVDRLDEAETHVAAALEAAPQDSEVLATKAAFALRQGDVAGALNAARAALEADPGNAAAGMVLIDERIRADDLERALELVEGYLAGDEKNVAFNLVKLQLLQNMGYETAVETHLLRLAEIFPDLPQFRTLLAQYYDRQGDTAAAEAQMRAIAEADPSNAAAALDVARFLIRGEGVEVGRAELERLIATAEDKFTFQMALAQLDHGTGREAEARALIEEIIASGGDADDVNAARVQLARFRLAGEDRAGARGLVEAVLAADANNVDALAIRAALLIDEEDYDAAILDLRTALHEAPRNVMLLQLAATAQERNGNPELAGERMAAAMRLSGYAPDSVLRYVRFLRGRGELNATETVLEEAVRRQPGERELLAALGMARLRLGDWGGAEAAAAGLRALGNPEAGRAAERIRAAALSGQEKFAEALDVLRRIAENPDETGSTIGAIVRTYVTAGQTEEAVAFVESELAKAPEDPLALRLRGALHQLAGEADEAEARYRAVIAARPDGPGGYAVLARFYLAEDQDAEAEQALRGGLAAVPDNPGLLLGLAYLLEAQGDFDAAIELYGRLYEVRPDSVVAANNFASIVADHRADDPASLERAFSAAKRLRTSKVPHSQDTYGWLQYLRGDYNGALRSLIPVAEALPDNPWVRYHIGMTYAKLGKGAEARPHLEAALDLAGDGPFPKADEIRATLMNLPEE